MLKELTAKSMLHYHEQTFATNWDANIYRGCEHNCRYCFAQYSHRYLDTANFFKDIFVKSNAPEILTRELNRRLWKKYPVNVCGVSDCYQPQEAGYKIMPDVIRSFITTKNPLVITTKSTLILRDIALLKELNELVDVSIVISVSTLDEEKRLLIEPNAAPTLERMKMLRQFTEIGCKTAVLFMPIIPCISDDQKNLNEIFKITKEYNLGPINAWPLHLRGKTRSVFFAFLKDHFPELLSDYRILYENGSVSDEYRNMLHKKIRDLREKYQLYSIYKPTAPKDCRPAQLALF
ncbi:radical SAM protein [bacterium]|nr:radical SAM protein [bacterium]